MSFFLHTLLIFLTLIFLSNAFAQGALPQPSVRLVYLLPNDRPARPDRIEALRQLIKDVPQFYANEMERHGYGRKTFRVETDRSGEPLVHRVTGRFAEEYYNRFTGQKAWEEIREYFDLAELHHIYFIAIDIESPWEGKHCGEAGNTFLPSSGGTPQRRFYDKITKGEEILGGFAVIPASGHCIDSGAFKLVAHELGHAFGLGHDFREGISSDYVMAYGNKTRLSKCAVEWLSVSPFFTTNPRSNNAPGEIRLVSTPTYSPEGVRLRFEVADTNGLHQAQLLLPAALGEELSDCKQLEGETSTIEFISTELTIGPVDSVMLQVIDVNGSITWATSLVDIAAVLPPPKVVSIPDPNLKRAIRSELGLTAGDTLTDQAMGKLESLNVDDRKITNIAGLEYATQLQELFIGGNQIKNYARLAELPNLTTLYLWTNNISDLSVLPLLPKLKFLDLNWNHIRDVNRLAGFTNLTTLMLRGNQIRDVSPLTELVNLEVLHLQGNPIQDASVLASLTKLRDIDIDIHQKPVPATGTWLAVQPPSGLSAANFVIKPGTFAIFVHKNQPSVSQPADFNTYRLHSVPGTADFPNLADFFQNGGRIELVSHPSLNPLPPNTREPEFGDVVISEIMWGLNGSNQGKQYIELYNTSGHTYTFANGDLMFRFSKASEEPLSEGIFTPPFNPNAQLKVIDKVSNTDWKVPGQSGNISRDHPLISMYRTIDYTTGNTPEGTLASSWRASTGRVNLLPPSYGTPGAAHLPPRPVVQVGASERPPMYWINVNSGTLHRLVGDEVGNLVPNVKDATGLAIDMTGGKLYWTERTGDTTGRIRRANLDGTNVQLVKNLTSVPHSIALDTANGKIYLTNTWGKIQRMNLDGSNFQPNLITGLESPRHLVLEVTGGKVYWTETTEASGRIRRANLNGSNVQNVATGLTAPLRLAIAAGKVYWTSVGKLQRANLDGTNNEVLETLPLAPTSIAVDTERSVLYLTTPSGEIHRRDLNGSGDEPVVTGLGSPSNIVLGISATTPGPTDASEPPVTPVVDTATDVNQDQKVNKTDLLLVVTALGESPPANPNFDVNADGTVNIADVLLVIEALDDPVAAAAPTLGETVTSLDPAFLTMQIDILRAESDGSMRYEHAIAFFQSLLASIRPTETQLLANYPNPFNPETWIPYQLAKPAEVTLRIYAANGALVRTLTLGHQPVGVYHSRSRAAYWDGRNALGEKVASGIYFYTLSADDFTATRKMLIMK
ncbi:MAG: dockerin type I domain-containing protein [Candidatus Poribacteria bacterium]|nr:dockerin type I domain-containing protein [Candidatus Poribacteria bacterium]